MARPEKIPEASTQRRDTYHHGDLKRALTEAALGLVTEKGPKGFTLREVARRAGVSAAAPYRHFSDKAQLLAAVATLGFVQLHDTPELLTAGARAFDDPRPQSPQWYPDSRGRGLATATPIGNARAPGMDTTTVTSAASR